LNGKTTGKTPIFPAWTIIIGFPSGINSRRHFGIASNFMHFVTRQGILLGIKPIFSEISFPSP